MPACMPACLANRQHMCELIVSAGTTPSPLLLASSAATSSQTMRIRQISHEATRNDTVGEKVAHWKAVFREKGEGGGKGGGEGVRGAGRVVVVVPCSRRGAVRRSQVRCPVGLKCLMLQRFHPPFGCGVTGRPF